MSEDPKSDETTGPFGKWIDRYALRYGAGTIVGAVIIVMIYARYAERRNIPLPADKVQWGAIAAALGFALCYVASAPIALMHVGRSIFFGKGTTKYLLPGGISILVPGVATFFLLIFGFHLSPLAALIGALYVGAWAGQAFVFIKTTTRHHEVYQWYDHLAKARAVRKDGLVESYRTLREHGNAFLVIVQELAMGLILCALIDDPSFPLTDISALFAIGAFICMIWVIPGACVWFCATRMEVDFVEATPKPNPAESPSKV